jgi:TonB family protein
MKTKSILLLAFSIFFTYSIANAFEPETMVKKTLTAKVKYPEKAQDKMIEGTVTVNFMIQEDGKVIITSAKSSNQILTDGVVDQLKATTIEPDPSFKGKTYSIDYTFKLIK